VHLVPTLRGFRWNFVTVVELDLAGLALCCETRGLVTLVIIMILKDTATFKYCLLFLYSYAWNITTSLGSVYRNTEPISDILKYRYRHRRRYSQYRKIPNSLSTIKYRKSESLFGICRQGLRTLQQNVYI